MTPQTQPDPSWIEYLKSVDTPTLANAIEALNLRPNAEGFTPFQVRCLFPELGRMCGHAVTAQVETVTQLEPADNMRFIELYQAVMASPKPTVIAFQEVGGHADYAAHCGEVMSTIFGRVGAVGLITDCGVRDIPEVRALRFHYFARGSVVSHANFRIVRVNVPVQIFGAVIRPGDVLHGDENGVLVVPPAPQAQLRDAVAEIRRREGELMEGRSRSTSLRRCRIPLRIWPAS